MIRAGLLCAPLALAACAAAGPASDAIAREVAREAVSRSIGNRFPGIPVEAAAGCIIDNASAAQIAAVAIEAANGRPGPRTAEVIGEVVAQPETLSCIGGIAASTLARGTLG